MPAHNELRNPDVAIERRDAPLPLYLFLALGLAAFVAISALALYLIYPSALSGPSDAPRGETAAPRLQISPTGEFARHRAAEEGKLTSYGWVDRQRGVVHIPIDQAMRDVAASGIKDWPKDAR